jgi:tRNA(adenine34) deaminase
MIGASRPDPSIMPLQESDFEPMRAALAQARLALDEGNLPIGAVIVHDGQIVATGRNGVDSGENDTHHAELAAIQSIPKFLFRHKRQCTVYATLEPCMMCMGAIVNSGITRVVFGVRDPLVGVAELLPQIPYTSSKTMELIEGVLRAESQALLDDYFLRTGARAHIASPGLRAEGQLPLVLPR